MSNELRAENIPCEFRDTDGFEATEGKLCASDSANRLKFVALCINLHLHYITFTNSDNGGGGSGEIVKAEKIGK